MMDIDNVRPLTLIPTQRMFMKREYQQWLEKFYTTTMMYFQFSRLILDKSDGD